MLIQLSKGTISVMLSSVNSHQVSQNRHQVHWTNRLTQHTTHYPDPSSALGNKKSKNPDFLTPASTGTQTNKQDEQTSKESTMTILIRLLCSHLPSTINHGQRSANFTPLQPDWTSRSLAMDYLVGLVVRRLPRERKIPGSNNACSVIFSGSSHTSDSKIGIPVATTAVVLNNEEYIFMNLCMCYCEYICVCMCLICNFYLGVAARIIVWADPSLRYTSMLLGC